MQSVIGNGGYQIRLGRIKNRIPVRTYNYLSCEKTGYDRESYRQTIHMC